MIRNINEDDYGFIIEKLNEWWSGRNMADMLPRLFFIHFQDSSFIFEEAGKIAGFLVGFISNTYKDTGYIHFIGVDPKFRKHKVATNLYKRFIEYCLDHGVSNIKCVTSPINAGSIKFHQRMGFKASSYDSDGYPLAIKSYDGPGGDRVLFNLKICT